MTLWLGKKPLVLASQSRARQTLLAGAGIPFDSDPADIDERAIHESSALSLAGDVARLLAREKARAVSTRHAARHVVGADQTLVLGNRIFNKPAGRGQAAEQLRMLAGHRHELHSAVAVAREGEILFEHVAVARLTMRRLRADEIDAYLDAAGGVVASSVGGYQLEGLGVHLFEQVEGDHFTILGLPLIPLLAFLRREHLLGF